MLALVGGRVVDPVDGGLGARAVVVDGGRIAAVGAPVPAGAERLDVTGCTVVPGFVDAHVHVQFASAAAVATGGVTAARDLGSPPSARAAWRGGPVALSTAGLVLTAPGGYPSRSWGPDSAREVAGPDDAAAAVAEQVTTGAGWIKVALEGRDGQPLLAPATVAAIVAAARRAGRRVTAHVGGVDALRRALTAGVDELAHLPLHDLDLGEARAIAAAGAVVVPTLAVPRDGDGRAALAAFRAAGGRVVYGSDLGNEGTAPGIDVAEVRALLAAGLAPREVLAAATVDAAAHLGLAGRGRVAPGAVADLVVVEGDLLTDPDAYGRVRLVLAAGRPVRRP